MMKPESLEKLNQEFDRQIETLIKRDYPALAGVAPEDFIRQISPLRLNLKRLASHERDADKERIPFVIVIKSDWVAPDQAILLSELKGKKAFTSMAGDDIKNFRSIDEIKIPQGPAYLILDIDTGQETLNVTPDEALKILAGKARSPLTIEEGIALITHYPEILKTKNCFSLLGSRCGDRRVTALWISTGRPRLGWCWAGNPHTWLGSASCDSRIGL